MGSIHIVLQESAMMDELKLGEIPTHEALLKEEIKTGRGETPQQVL